MTVSAGVIALYAAQEPTSITTRTPLNNIAIAPTCEPRVPLGPSGAITRQPADDGPKFGQADRITNSYYINPKMVEPRRHHLFFFGSTIFERPPRHARDTRQTRHGQTRGPQPRHPTSPLSLGSLPKSATRWTQHSSSWPDNVGWPRRLLRAARSSNS